MKKALSLILCGLFLNLMYSPAILAYEEVQTSNETQYVSDSNVVAQNSSQNSVEVPAVYTDRTQTSVDTTVQKQEDKNVVQVDAEKTEHLSIKKNRSKKIEVESVYVSSHDVIIPAQDVLQLAFMSDFNGRKAHVGDTIEFRFPNDIVTQEGTMIIPSTARVIAEITQLKKPKPFHLSGKVYLNFKYIEVNGTRKPIEARLYGKKDFLSRKTLNNTVAVGETAAITGAGAVAGAVICAETATDAAVIVFGSAVTAGFGAIVGVAVGILLPGASFKAKAGQRVDIQLTEELDI